MNTGVDSLSFLQGIFPTQELNQSLQLDSLPIVPPGKPALLLADSSKDFPDTEGKFDVSRSPSYLSW